MSLRSILPLAFVTLHLLGCAEPAGDPSEKPGHAVAHVESARIEHQTMRPLAFLLGAWEGSGSITLGPGAAHPFVQTEKVEPRLDGVVVTIEGLGRSPTDDSVVHHAFAVLFHDAAHGFRIRSFTRDGRTVESDVTVGERTLTWGFTAGPQTTRFTITVTPDGRWVETGESSRDGTTWFPFFAMELTRR